MTDNANLYALIRSAFPSNLQTDCLITAQGANYSWSDLDLASGKIANLLASLNLPKGARIAVQVEKSPEALLLYLAALRAGLIFIPLNTAYHSAEMRYFIELALNLDAGRYPSLPKFIQALNDFRQGDEGDAPDESAVENSADALNILTIHSAKGLEARLVVIVDANHSDGAVDRSGILYEWPLTDATTLRHFSAFGRKNQRGASRDGLFAMEQQLAEQENWNLLYVALTRAKQWLVVSGVAKNKTPVAENSWYDRLQCVPETELAAMSADQVCLPAAQDPGPQNC